MEGKGKFTIPYSEIYKILSIKKKDFPKYVSPLLNLANNFAHSTRPKVVGQMTELFKQYLEDMSKQNKEVSIETWSNWYKQNYGQNLEAAYRKLKEKLEELKKVLNTITDDEIKAWIEDLVINKTFEGLYVQKPILVKLKEILKCENFRLSNPEEEKRNIDAFLICNGQEIPIQIKAETYKEKQKYLGESIIIPIVYYKKTKEGLQIDYSQLLQYLQRENKEKDGLK